MLWSAILFIWELVGIDLAKAEATGGNVGAILTAIKSPQAIPWVLLILVGYFAFKLRIEWRQCGETRRLVREAKQDYYSAWGVAVAACILYIGQAVSRVQFADILADRSKTVSLATSAVAVATIEQALLQPTGLFPVFLPKYITRRQSRLLYALAGPLLIVFFPLLRVRVNWTMILIGSLSGTLIFGGPTLWLRMRHQKRIRDSDDEASSLPKNSPSAQKPSV